MYLKFFLKSAFSSSYQKKDYGSDDFFSAETAFFLEKCWWFREMCVLLQRN